MPARQLICFSPRYIPTKFKRRCETVDLNTRCDGARPVLREKSISFLLAFIKWYVPIAPKNHINRLATYITTIQ